MNKLVTFRNWTCRVVEHKYPNGRTALHLVDAQTEEPIATATVNLPQTPLSPGEILLKGWSENTGLPEALEEAGIVKLTGAVASTGFVYAQIAIYPPLKHKTIEWDEEPAF